MNAVIVSSVCSILGTAMAIFGFMRLSKKDVQTTAGNSIRLESKLDYVSDGINDIKLDMKAQNLKISDMTERMARVEELTKSAHRRIDEIVKEED